MQIVDKSHALLALDVEDINVVKRSRYHLALRLEPLYQFQFFLQRLCFFKPQLLRQRHHFLFQLFRQGVRVALQDFATGFNILQIFLTRLPSYARARTVVDMKVQTNLIFAALHAFPRHRSATGTRVIQLFAQIQQGIHRWNVAIRTVKRSTAHVTLSCGKNTRQIFVRNGNGGVRLVVFEQHVIPRFVLLDKIVLQQ